MQGKGLTRRDFLRMSTLATMGSFLVACTSVAPPAGSPGAEAAEAEAAQTSEKTQLEWWPGWPGEFMITIGDLFMEKNPDVELNVVSVYPEMQQVLASIASGTAPDMIADVPYLELIIRDVCQPLDDFIEASEEVSIDDGDIRVAHWEVFSWEGAHYGVPSVDTAGRGGMSFNLNVIEEAGLDPTALPETWEEVFAWHEQITKFDDAGNIAILGMNPIAERAGAASEGDPWLWPEMWGYHYIDETLTYQVDREETVAFLQVIKDFFDFVGVEKMEGLALAMDGISRGAFGVGQQGMQITYPSGPAGVLRSNPDHTYKFTWVPVPDSRRGTKVQTLAGHASILMKDKPNPEAAFDLAVFLTQKEACDILFKEVGWIGPRKSWQEALDLSEYPPEVQENILFFTTSIDEADELWYEKDPIEGITNVQWVTAREDVIYNKATPAEAAAKLQETLTAELAEALESR
jgi:ABC-type glycerol-3-phosphate transport system substrate-binding protein